MRTTLTLDDDVAVKLRDLAHRRKVSFKEALNSVLRRGLNAQEGPAEAALAFRIDTFRSSFRPGVDSLKLNQLNDELEARRLGEATSSRP